jgi:hypothetical protein
MTAQFDQDERPSGLFGRNRRSLIVSLAAATYHGCGSAGTPTIKEVPSWRFLNRQSCSSFRSRHPTRASTRDSWLRRRSWPVTAAEPSMRIATICAGSPNGLTTTGSPRPRSIAGCRRVRVLQVRPHRRHHPAQYVRCPHVHPTEARGLGRSEFGVFLFTAERFDRDPLRARRTAGTQRLRVSDDFDRRRQNFDRHAASVVVAFIASG